MIYVWNVVKNKLKTQLYQVNWSWSHDLDDVLEKKFKGLTILNFPSGKSRIGLRADLDPTVDTDILADLFMPQENFKPGSFEVVICDPPFQYYNKFKWVLEIKDICSKYFVLCTPCQFYSFKGFSDPEIIAARGSRTGCSTFLRFFFIYKKLNHSII